MNTYTIVDALGEVYKTITTNKPDAVALNTPPGFTAVAELPTSPDAYWLNGQWNTRPAQPAPTYTWNPETKAWADVRTLADAKASKRQELAAAWKVVMRSGVTVGGKVAPTTSEAWVDYLTLKLMASEAGWVDTPIQLADGTFELLTTVKAAALWDALKVLRRTQTAKLENKIVLVNAAATLAAIDAITWD